MDRIGTYDTKPFSKDRKNIALMLKENKRHNVIHSLVEIDVTNAKEKIREYREKKGINISFTGWFIKCYAQALSEHPMLNSLKHGRNKIITFHDVDVAVPVERTVSDDDIRPMVCIIRKANEKNVMTISDEIRNAQQQVVSETTLLLGQQLTRLERFAINAPTIVQKLMLLVTRNNAFLKKKYMGTTNTTAVGVVTGTFPGWAHGLGGYFTTQLAIGGLVKKTLMINGVPTARDHLYVDIAVNHDIADGGPMARLVARLCELTDQAFGLDALNP